MTNQLNDAFIHYPNQTKESCDESSPDAEKFSETQTSSIGKLASTINKSNFTALLLSSPSIIHISSTQDSLIKSSFRSLSQQDCFQVVN